MSSNVNEEKSKSTTLELNNGPTRSPSPYMIHEEHAAVIGDYDESIDQYKKGIISKAAMYLKIQGWIREADGDDTATAEAYFELYIQTIESLDSEVKHALGKGKGVGEKRQADTPELYELREGFEEEERFKKPKVDEAEVPWATRKKFIQPMSESLSKHCNYLSCSVSIPKTPSNLSLTHWIVLTPNGRMSYWDEQSNWTMSSVGKSPHPTMMFELKQSEISRYLLEWLSPPKPSQMVETGQLLGVTATDSSHIYSDLFRCCSGSLHNISDIPAFWVICQVIRLTHIQLFVHVCLWLRQLFISLTHSCDSQWCDHWCDWW
jgi:hypothetical protein